MEKKIMLLNIIDRVVVHKDGSVSVTYRIEARGFGKLRAIDAPNWLPAINGIQGGETLKTAENATSAAFSADSGVDHTMVEIPSTPCRQSAPSESAGSRYFSRKKTLTASTASAIWY
jgi:hypothetical protein